MISGTAAQEKLIDFKKRNSHTSNDQTKLGSIGRGYWDAFMKRNDRLIESRRGQKYELDRASWTTYRNFKDMYDHNYAAMEGVGVAKLLDSAQ